MDWFSQYGFLGALLLSGIVLGAIPVVLPLIISPRARGRKSRETYECGMDTIGSAWVRFDIAYYLFALIFVAFEVDVLYILPIAVIYDSGTYVWRDFIETHNLRRHSFLAIVYAWSKGVFALEESIMAQTELPLVAGDPKNIEELREQVGPLVHMDLLENLLNHARSRSLVAPSHSAWPVAPSK